MKARSEAIPPFLLCLFALLLSGRFAAAEEGSASGSLPIRQSVRAEVEQRGFLQKPREEELGQPDWRLELQADASWRVALGERLSLSVSPRVDWQEDGGFVDGFDFSEEATQQGEREFSIHRAEASFSLSEWGLRLLAGKLRPQFGVNYVEPLSIVNLRGRDSYDDGSWLSGLLLGSGTFTLEAYGQATEDPELCAALSALLDLHEVGVMYRREGGSLGSAGDFFGGWYRTQVGDGLIPYFELGLRSDSDFLDLDGLEERDLGWNAEVLAGLGWSPPAWNLSAYLEYRYRQAGYGGSDWDRVRSGGLRAAGAYLGDFPYLQTATHAFGLHLRNQDEVFGRFDWSATCVYLLPDGFYADALVETSFVERLRLGLKVQVVDSFSSDASSKSEASFWPYDRRLTLYAVWKIDAREDAYDGL